MSVGWSWELECITSPHSFHREEFQPQRDNMSVLTDETAPCSFLWRVQQKISWRVVGERRGSYFEGMWKQHVFEPCSGRLLGSAKDQSDHLKYYDRCSQLQINIISASKILYDLNFFRGSLKLNRFNHFKNVPFLQLMKNTKLYC